MSEVKGVVKRVLATEVVSEKFKKRVLHITTEDKFPQTTEFQATQDKVDLMDGLKEGQEVTVHFNLRGREWTNPSGEVKVFNTLEIWKIDANYVAPKTEPKKEVEGDQLPF